MNIHAITAQELPQVTRLWNEIVEEGAYFPEDTPLTKEQAADFFQAQTRAAVCTDEAGDFLGFYILHPNGVGRRSHIANASYGVSKAARGQGVGKALVLDSLKAAHENGFTGLQFNAVVATNFAAIHLYFALGFQCVGRVPGGYRQKGRGLTDIYLFYHDCKSEYLQ